MCIQSGNMILNESGCMGRHDISILKLPEMFPDQGVVRQLFEDIGWAAGNRWNPLHNLLYNNKILYPMAWSD